MKFRSILTKATILLVVVLLLSLAEFAVMSRIFIHQAVPYFDQVTALQRDDAIKAYEQGGPQELRRSLDTLSARLSMRYYLSDRYGKDLVTGISRSDLVDRPPKFIGFNDEIALSLHSPDGRYIFVTVTRAPSERSFFLLYAIVPCAVLVLGALFVVMIAWPLRNLTENVIRLGKGDLRVRTASTRKDEIGELSRAFDAMADRIETLLTAERQLLQDISHELRTPLTRLQFAIALQRLHPGREQEGAAVDREIDRMTELVAALLQVTRVEGDPGARAAEVVGLAELLEKTLRECELDAAAHNCRLALSIEAQPTLMADVELLRRALENVLRNAIAYSPVTKEVIVRLYVEGHTAVITVRDFGPGVPEEYMDNLFRPFFRVDPSRSKASGGVGLGLAIARRAIEAHGGRISASNTAPGLAVHMELPLTIS